MALNSYKQWRLLNESFGALGPITLGLGKQHSIGVVGSQLGEDPKEGDELEEGKCGGKKCSKKMDADVDIEPDDDEEVPDEAPEEELPKDKELKDDDEEGDEEKDSDDETDDVPDDEEDSDPDITKKPLLMKKKCKAGMKKAMKKGMKKEDQEWWNSIHNMLLADPEAKSWDGFSRIKEDALLPPADANAGLANMEPELANDPQPGEPGFAPQTRIGS